MDHKEEIQPTGRIEELSPVISGEEMMEDTEASNSNGKEITLVEGHLDFTRPSEEEESAISLASPEGFWGIKWEFKDEKDTFVFFENNNDQWSTAMEDNPWADWDSEWTDHGTYCVTSMEIEPVLDQALGLDEVEEEFPKGHFLRVYPETQGSKAGDIWVELPGYTSGRIGFMMLLNDHGTMGWEGFCWAAREEQNLIAETYRPFWKEWEKSAYGC
ncbi:hypothetical protein VP01_4244g2 [Puccinia sorghi]|uniref:Uncharacterized protein n=1 Tax=Puccinia sorghi TaxID=27349 RepID=A0A0L6UQG7_9BASI|nr:hypothetical protein VP01_4244g2 [Puccinia sorghi]